MTLLWLLLVTLLFGFSVHQPTHLDQCPGYSNTANCHSSGFDWLKCKVDQLTEQMQKERQETKKEITELKQQLKTCCNVPTSNSPQWLSGGHYAERSYAEIIPQVIENNNRTWIHSGETNAYRMSIVDSFIWLPLVSNKTILVLSPHTSHKQKEINFTLSNLSPMSVYQVTKYLVGLATERGLFCLNLDGSIQYNAAGGAFSDLASEGNTLVAYDYSNNSIAVVHASDSKKWQLHRSFTATRSQPSSRNTIQISRNVIYVSLFHGNFIQTYNLQGQYINNFGNRGSSPGILIGPSLCGSDIHGAVLLCDQYQYQLQVLSPTGQWTIYRPFLNHLNQILFDSTGNMWSLDQNYMTGRWRIFKYNV